ncbi:regulatory protein RecX [Thiococcus pfennigii]|uniref:regulatory protein RecX n=1 Tax=Thiococcus pfennigii TaxID=1057 RepID=UPI003B8348DA
MDPEPRDVALRLLAARDHSRLELRRKLVARGFAPEAVEAALDRLGEEGLLSESRLAEAYVAERLAKGFGPLRVREELRRKGLADALIDPHLQHDTEQWLERLAAVHDKRYGPGRPGDRKEQARRARFLAARGFPGELIGRFLLHDG